MQDYSKLQKETRAQLEEKDFIKWLVEDLDRLQQGALLLACGKKISGKAMKSFPAQYIINQLMLVRKKMVLEVILPPFPFILPYKEEELTAEKLIEIAKENECNQKETALMLLLQNHYEDALKQYNKRTDEKQIETVEETTEEVIELPAEDVSPKIEKKLRERIQTLTREKEELLEQVKNIKEELKQRNLTTQSEINELQRNLAEETTKRTSLEEDYVKLQEDLLKEKAAKNHLAAEKLVLETKVETVLEKHKKKVALIGDPMNASLLAMKEIEINIYDIEEMDAFVESWNTYDYLFYLTYTIDEMIYEEAMPENLQGKIEHIDNFMMLKRKMGEIAYV